MSEMLELRHISKTFGAGTINEKKAVEDLSLTLASGDFVTIIGGNGAGKSTLFNAVAGVFYVDEGRVILDGEDMTFLPEYKRSNHLGRLFQDPLKGTAPHMTIEENLALAYLRSVRTRSPFGTVSKKDREYFRERLAALGLGLEDRLKSPVGLLSGGQRQALTLLMATLVTPKLLLLDEHTAALDPSTAEKVLELTRSIVAENNITCMMITHNIRSGAGAWQPHHYDGCGPHRAGPCGGGARGHDGGRAAGKIPYERGQRAGQRPHPAQRQGVKSAAGICEKIKSYKNSRRLFFRRCGPSPARGR